MNDKQPLYTALGGVLIAMPILGILSGVLGLSAEVTPLFAIASLFAEAFIVLTTLALAIYLYHKSPTVAILLGGLGMVSGITGGAGWGFASLFETAAASAGIGDAFSEAITASTPVTMMLQPFGMLGALSLIGLIISLYRANLIPAWVAAVQVVAILLFIAGWFVLPVAPVAWVVGLVGFGWLGWQMMQSAEMPLVFAR